MFRQFDKIYRISSLSDIEINHSSSSPIGDLDAKEINANWEKKLDKFPHLFDGTVIYSSLNENPLTINIYLIKFRSFIYLSDHDLIPPYEGILGCKVIIHHNGRVMIGQRNNTLDYLPGYWTSVGGLYDNIQDNFIEATIYREIHEETGVNLDHLPLDYYGISVRKSSGPQIITSIKLPQSFDSYQFKVNKEWNGKFEYYFSLQLMKLDRNFTEELALVSQIVN